MWKAFCNFVCRKLGCVITIELEVEDPSDLDESHNFDQNGVPP